MQAPKPLRTTHAPLKTLRGHMPSPDPTQTHAAPNPARRHKPFRNRHGHYTPQTRTHSWKQFELMPLRPNTGTHSPTPSTHPLGSHGHTYFSDPTRARTPQSPLVHAPRNPNGAHTLQKRRQAHGQAQPGHTTLTALGAAPARDPQTQPGSAHAWKTNTDPRPSDPRCAHAL